MNLDLTKQTKELEGLSKLLFDKAVLYRYSALGVEVFAGLLAVTVTFFTPPINLIYSLAILGFVLLTTAYVLKVLFSHVYDIAETMRRQAVFANGLGWQINFVQFSEWRRIAGKALLIKNDTAPLQDDYYETEQEVGESRLLEMVTESAFWTRHLYKNIQFYLWFVVVLSLALFVLVLAFTSSSLVTSELSIRIAYTLFLIMPLLLTIDVFGWALKLGGLAKAIQQIEDDLIRLSVEDQYSESDVLRLVSEYNCQLVQGFPIPSWFFNWKHDEIDDLWKRR